MENKFIPNSFQIPNALIDELMCEISPNALKCYLIIARKTTGWQKEWDKISTTQLMKLSGIKKKDTVYKAMKELEEFCLIESEKTLGKLTEYRLVPKNGTSTNKSNEPVPEKGTTTSTKKGDSTKDTNTKDNNTKYKKLTKKEKDLFNEYLDLRKSLKLKNTENIINRLLNKYFKFGRKLEVIENAITANWKDFYEPKFQQNISLAEKNKKFMDDKYEQLFGSNNIVDCEVVS